MRARAGRPVDRQRPAPPKSARTVSALALALLYIPLVVLVFSSFRTGPAQEPGWTLEWYGRAFANAQVLDALLLSLWVGAWTTVVSTVLGTTAALGMERLRGKVLAGFEALIHVPLIMPEIVLGLSLLVWFVLLRITLGSFSIILGHVTFSLSYVIITVRARLEGFDSSLEEAARDLGATPWQSFWRIKLPLIWPGVVSGALMAFTLSFDDFLVTFFTAGVSSDTLPTRIYAMIKFGVSPEISALSTVMLAATLALVLLVFGPRGTREAA